MKSQLRLHVGKLYRVRKPGVILPAGNGMRTKTASFLNTTTGLDHAKTYDWKFNDHLDDGCAVIYLGTKPCDGGAQARRKVWYEFLGPDGKNHYIYQRFEDEMFAALLTTAEEVTR